MLIRRCLSQKNKLIWLSEQKTYISNVITKSLFSSHLVNLTLICWRWMLLGCNWQINGGLDFEPYTDNVSLHLRAKSSSMSLLFSHHLLLSKSRWLTISRSFVFVARHYLTRERGLKLRASGLSAVYFFCTGCVCTRGKLADLPELKCSWWK